MPQLAKDGKSFLFLILEDEPTRALRKEHESNEHDQGRYHG
jgi:hypothetical protein